MNLTFLGITKTHDNATRSQQSNSTSEITVLNPFRTEDFLTFLSIKLIFWVHLLNKSRKIQYIWHYFFNGT